MANVSNLPSNVSSITKQRIKLNVKVLGVQLGSPGGAQDGLQPGQAAGERPSYREQFTAPEMSIVSKFMSKVSAGSESDTWWGKQRMIERERRTVGTEQKH